MKTIEIDDALYGFLLRSTERFGEPVSETIRRLLRLRAHIEVQDIRQGEHSDERGQGPISNVESQNGLAEYLGSHEFLLKRRVVDRFLGILSFACKRNPEQFARVAAENNTGRIRMYFAQTADELRATGSSVNPKAIPSSGYWVVTNNPTSQKQTILGGVLQGLGYNEREVRLARSKLVPGDRII